jgi:hypothetical protein
VPAGASVPSSSLPSHVAERTPGPLVSKLATTWGAPSSVRRTRKTVGPRSDAFRTRTSTGVASGPAIHWSPRASGSASRRSTIGSGAVVSSRISRGKVTARPWRRSPTRTR